MSNTFVAILMGSQSDAEIMKKASDVLDELGITSVKDGCAPEGSCLRLERHGADARPHQAGCREAAPHR